MSPLEELQKKLKELEIVVDKEIEIKPQTKKIQGEFVDKQVELFGQLKGLLEKELEGLNAELMRLEDIKQKTEKGGSSGNR